MSTTDKATPRPVAHQHSDWAAMQLVKARRAMLQGDQHQAIVALLEVAEAVVALMPDHCPACEILLASARGEAQG